jgi:hypothetical protein
LIVARYDFRCPNDGRVHELQWPINDEKPVVLCEDCGAQCEQAFFPWTTPFFAEDKMRFWRNDKGNRFSRTFGQEMPESRKELRRLEKEKGCELISPSEMPENWKRCVEYAEHRKHGGEHDKNQAQFIPPPEKPKTLTQIMAEKNVRFG